MRKFKYTFIHKCEKLTGKCEAMNHHNAYEVARKVSAGKLGVCTGDITIITMKQTRGFRAA